MNCKNAMDQGYADLAHKMGCDLPNTGSDLALWVVIGLAVAVIGFCFLIAARRRGTGE